ncbi:MAG: DNA mismatch repair protein MutS [Desulfomicrobiaceae bacterium]
MTQTKMTPMMEQYLGVKAQYPEALLFFRMGDFFELFFEDAEIAARELQIALTSRNPHAEHPVPMCGIPHHALHEYSRILLERGYSIAVCDQVEDPRQAKGLVRREVTRVLTPGTVVEDASLEAESANFLAAVLVEDDGAAVAWADVSTGQWSGVAAKDADTVLAWLSKIEPREILVPDRQQTPLPPGIAARRITRWPLAHFDLASAAERVKSAQRVASLSALDLEDTPQLTRCCGALLSYLEMTHRCPATHLQPFSPVDIRAGLLIDDLTTRNLEIFRTLDGRKGKGTLWHLLDATRTPMGARLLAARLRQPWRDQAPIERMLDAVAFLRDHDQERQALARLLDDVYDLERLATRIHMNRTNPRDLAALRHTLTMLPRLRGWLARLQPLPEELATIEHHWDDLAEAADLLTRALADNPPALITEGGIFRSGFDPRLDELLELSEHGEEALGRLLQEEQERSALPKLKLGYNRVFGYYFELSRAQADGAPAHFIRRQTLATAERYITDELKKLEERILGACEARKAREYELFTELRATLAKWHPRLTAQADRLARLDVAQSLAEAALRHGWCRPEIHEGMDIVLRQSRHPVVEAAVGRGNTIPSDIRLEDPTRMLLITGPNMAGKSTILRQTAIACILAQIGSFVPAASARIGLCDRIFSRVGASDNLAQGYSTFMVEMIETARILRQATRRSLVILDEIGRGTSTFDGMSLAWAVAEELMRRHGGIRTLFATHYHELTALEASLPGVQNCTMAIKEWKGEIIFLHRLVPGPSDRSYGIEVARLAGVPAPVIQRAKEILRQLEARGKKTVSCTPLRFTDAPSQPSPHPVLRELQALSLASIAPDEALALVTRWKHLVETSP